MKTARKAILLVLCAILLVVSAVMGTLAYLTDTEAVTNTFTVGKVGLSLDEKDVDDSKTDTTTPGRDKANKYHLLPGHTYDKDPIVHIDEDSEDCWVFVKVENGINLIEAENTAATATTPAYKDIHTQITDYGWVELPVNGVTVTGDTEAKTVRIYYKSWNKFVATDTEQTKPAGHHDLHVFDEFKIDGTKAVNSGADNQTTFDINSYVSASNANSLIKVTAYAIQKDGINVAADAWDLGAWS